jgi:3-hydroxyisobutyrate dehydrogenase-like beta-hydroxyacid dehydrogenase
MTEKMTIAWIGVGKMGTPMSGNLMKAGYPVILYDVDGKKTKALAGQAAGIAASPREAASKADVTISIIPDDAVLEEVALGPEGVLAGAGPGKIYVDMSTVSPIISGRVAEAAEKRGVEYIRAPVSGSTVFAAGGNLTILASGPKDAFERCFPLFEIMGKKILHVGERDQARVLKLLINMMVAITSAMTAEALTFGKLGGMDWNQMIDAVNSSAVGAPQINFKAPILKERNFAPAFSATQMAKDLDIALNTGRTMNAPMPITSMVRQFLTAMIAQGRGEMDFFGLVTLLEKLGGIEDG